MSSGKFNTSIKTKIQTPHGNILKVTHYRQRDEEEPCDDYRIRPECSICGGDVGCVCYNDNNSDDPLKSATDGLQQRWCCDNPQCLCDWVKNDNPEKWKELTDKYSDDIWTISEALCEEWGDYGEDIFCEV